jgi:hypothetical protein
MIIDPDAFPVIFTFHSSGTSEPLTFEGPAVVHGMKIRGALGWTFLWFRGCQHEAAREKDQIQSVETLAWNRDSDPEKLLNGCVVTIFGPIKVSPEAPLNVSSWCEPWAPSRAVKIELLGEPSKGAGVEGQPRGRQ